MTKHGYHDEQTGEFVETPFVRNAVFKEQYQRGLYCETGQHYMKLLSEDGSISRDIPAHRWSCQCKSITLSNIKLVFDRCCETFKALYRLNELDYHQDTKHFEIESSEWVSPNQSRLNAKRRKLSNEERQDILEMLQQAIGDELGVIFETLADLFAE